MTNEIKLFLRAPNNYDTKEASDESATLNDEVSMTVQSEAEETDINTIVRRFGITGHLPENVRLPTYGDFTGVTDYRSALEAVNNAEENFMALPAETRARFQNDPQQLLAFVQTASKDQLGQAGLLEHWMPPAPAQEPPAKPVASKEPGAPT